jgi:NADPH:quinone reductase-like Zn-dependent oxidoreductase
MWKQAHLHGIRVGDVAMFQQMNRAIETNQLRPIVDRVFGFDDAAAAYHYQNAGSFVGKVVISM